MKDKTHLLIAPKSRKTPLAFDAVIFDIDNVLIDTRHSYRDAIRWTVEIYLTHGSVPLFSPSSKGGRLDGSLLSAKDADQFKLLGGFNDDWDCCYGLLVYLLSLPIKSRTIETLKKAVNLRKFLKQVKKRPLRVTGIVEMLGRPSSVIIEKIARIFQEVYLGKELFKAAEGKEPFYWKKLGLIHKEKLIFRKSTLTKLKKLGVHLGIATGRPRFEALHALKHFGILEFFDSITTIDEVKKAEGEMKRSLRKPHPYSLIETAKKINSAKRFLYIGDLPDDILAANHAKSTLHIRSAAFPWFAADPKTALLEIQKQNPDFILKKPSDLTKVVLGRS